MQTLPGQDDRDGGKLCGGCDTVKPAEAFARNRQRRDGLQVRCRACNKTYRDRPDHKERQVAYHKDWYALTGWKRRIVSSYQVPGGWYEETLGAQGGGCAICGKTESGNGRRLVVDHDHSCCPADPRPNRPACGRCVRGIICDTCNKGLGILEQVQWVQKAQHYLNRIVEIEQAKED